jgi:histidinol dehydrogenase
VARRRVAGAVFVGAGASTAFGDYVAGANHVLPTGGAARFGGPLGPRSFLRRTSVVSIPEDAARRLAPQVDRIAREEGLPVHGESAQANVAETSED